MKILVLCSGGMSTSLLVNSMKKSGEAREENFIIESGSVSGLSKIVENYDVILLAPQVRHRLEEVKNITSKFNKPVVLIKPEVYGLIDGNGALKQALEANLK